MEKQILVPLDGSIFAEYALDPAQTIASGSGSVLLVRPQEAPEEEYHD